MEYTPSVVADLTQLQLWHADPILFWVLGTALLCFLSYRAGVRRGEKRNADGRDAEYEPSIIPGLAHFELGHPALALMWFFSTLLLFGAFWPAAIISIVTCYNDAKRIEQSDRLKRKAGLH